MSRVSSQRNKPVIGLTGGIGSGKTTVAEVFRLLGAGVIDFDRLAHAVLADPQVVASLRRWWGDGVVGADGAVDRAAVAAIVFDDAAELARLESLVYPHLEAPRKELTAQFQADPAVSAVVWDAPKLSEAGLDRLCDAVVFVDADRPQRVSRVAATRGWTEAELVRREKLQKPLDKKRTDADHVVRNHSGIEQLRSQAKRVFAEVLASFT